MLVVTLNLFEMLGVPLDLYGGNARERIGVSLKVLIEVVKGNYNVFTNLITNTNKIIVFKVNLFLRFGAKRAGESADNTANETTAQDTGTAAETTTAVQYEAPEVTDYDGYEYRIGINANRNVNASIIIAEEANGEAFNDAVYERNEKIGELYNIKIKGLVADANDIHLKMQTAVLAGDDLYDVAAMGMRQHFPLAQIRIQGSHGKGLIFIHFHWSSPFFFTANIAQKAGIRNKNTLQKQGVSYIIR